MANWLLETIMADRYPSRILICGLGVLVVGIFVYSVRFHQILKFQFFVRPGIPCAEDDLANQTFTELSDASLWKPQAAIICTPASDHLNKALPLARLAVPLLIEKPIGTGMNDLMIGKNWFAYQNSADRNCLCSSS